MPCSFELNENLVDSDRISSFNLNRLNFTVAFRFKDVLHLHGFDNAQVLSINHGLANLYVDADDGTGHGGQDGPAVVDLDWDCHVVLVLILGFVVKHRVDLTTLVIEIILKIVLLSNQLQCLFALVFEMHLDQRIMLKCKVVHLVLARVTACHASNGVAVAAVLDLPVTITFVSLGEDRNVDDLVGIATTRGSILVIVRADVFQLVCGKS